MGNLYGTEGGEAMKEDLKRKEAFEFFYKLNGRPTAENCKKVSDKCQISERTFWRWYKELNWKLRIEQRDIENAKKVEQKTNSEIIDAKADFRKTIFAIHQMLKKSLNEFIKKNETIQILTTKDLGRVVLILDKLARLDMGLVGEVVDHTDVKMEDVLKIASLLRENKDLKEQLLGVLDDTRSGNS